MQSPANNTQPRPADPAKRPNEQGKILVQDYFVIKDRANNQVLVKGRG